MQTPQNKWHVVKDIPLALIFTIGAQTFTAIWWLASLSAKIDYIKEANVAAAAAQLAVDKRQDEEQARLEQRVLVQFERVNAKLDRIIEARPR